MAFIDVDIEDYIDEISDYNLIKELKKRADQGKEEAVLVFKWPEIETVLDQQKQDWVIENWNNIQP